MFRNQIGELCADAEAVAQRIKGASDEDVEAVSERTVVLRDALNALDARLLDLPDRERNAARSFLYKGITDLVFDFHLSLETSDTRAKMARATTRTEKTEALQEFRVHTQDLMMLYGIK